MYSSVLVSPVCVCDLQLPNLCACWCVCVCVQQPHTQKIIIKTTTAAHLDEAGNVFRSVTRTEGTRCTPNVRTVNMCF